MEKGGKDAIRFEASAISDDESSIYTQKIKPQNDISKDRLGSKFLANRRILVS